MQLLTVRPDWYVPRDMRIFRQAFKYATEQLGLTDHNEAVEVRFNPYMNEKEKAGLSAEARDPFAVHIQRGPMTNAIPSLFHEMTHVKQRVRGELESCESYVRFKGKYFYQRDLPTDELGSLEEFERYQALPWEVEARAMTSQLEEGFAKLLSNRDRRYLLEHCLIWGRITNK